MTHIETATAAERIETLAMHDLFAAVPRAARAVLGLEQCEIGGARLFMARNEPSILFNRVLGLGSRPGVTAEDVAAIRDRYAGAGVGSYFLHIQPWARPAELWNWLFEAGLERDRGWTQFLRGAGPTEVPTNELQVIPIGPERALDFARIAAQGFDLGEAAVPALAALVGLPGWHHFMSFSGDRPAGVAALRVEGELAWFDWAATVPEFRRRGSQTALLRRRVDTAIALGCRLLLTETGEAVAGDPQHSFRNLTRAGFVPTHTRDNFVPGAAQAQAAR